MKFKDYVPTKYLRFVYILFRIDGKEYDLEEAIEKIPDHEVPEELINYELASEFDSFFEQIEEIKTESKLKSFIFEITEPHDFTESRSENIILLLELFEETSYKLESWKQEVIESWAHRFIANNNHLNLISPPKDKKISISKDKTVNNSNKNRGAKYARQHYAEIKKILPVTGVITSAVRQFDPSLTEEEVERVRRKVSYLLKEEGLVYPYRH